MANLLKITVAAFSLVFANAAPVQAQTFDDGAAAFQAGDFAAALENWRPLAEQGHARAQAALGRMHEYGRGVERNDAEAIVWYGKAAEQGIAVAQYRLGVLKDNGWGTPVNDAEAVVWYRKAATQGHPLAQYDLASMYVAGTGVEQDYLRAYMWLRISVVQGNDLMVKHLYSVSRKMTAAQIDQARNMAAEWLARHRQ